MLKDRTIFINLFCRPSYACYKGKQSTMYSFASTYTNQEESDVIIAVLVHSNASNALTPVRFRQVFVTSTRSERIDARSIWMSLTFSPSWTYGAGDRPSPVGDVREELGGLRRFSLFWILTALIQISGCPYLRRLWCRWIGVAWTLPLTFARVRWSWSSSDRTNFKQWSDFRVTSSIVNFHHISDFYIILYELSSGLILL